MFSAWHFPNGASNFLVCIFSNCFPPITQKCQTRSGTIASKMAYSRQNCNFILKWNNSFKNIKVYQCIFGHHFHCPPNIQFLFEFQESYNFANNFHFSPFYFPSFGQFFVVRRKTSRNFEQRSSFQFLVSSATFWCTRIFPEILQFKSSQK